jgi:adenylate kinase
MDAGQLVPDDLIIRMMEPELASEGGKLLDGFPRTVAQAEALDVLLVKHGAAAATAILFEVDIDVMKERLSGRWTNPRTGRTYHDTFNPPKMSGVDDEDGGALVQRDDDKPEAVATRLDVYEKQTTPLIGYYEKSGRLAKINALAPIADVSKEIVALVEGVKAA